MTVRRASLGGSLAVVGVAALVGFWAGNAVDRSRGQARPAPATPPAKPPKPSKAADGGDTYLKQSPGAIADGRESCDYGLGECAADKLKPYPAPCKPGDRTPFDLYRYAGRGPSSWGAPTLHTTWDKWLEHCKEQKPKLMAECRAYMAKLYDFHGRYIPGAKMSGGKPIMAGPVARLPKEFSSWEELARVSPDEMKRRDVFPFKPLAHPLQSTAHMLFPEQWTRIHPEHVRIDCDFDIPDAYLPEFPPPLFLTTHKELGDVTKGREITLGNY